MKKVPWTLRELLFEKVRVRPPKISKRDIWAGTEKQETGSDTKTS